MKPALFLSMFLLSLGAFAQQQPFTKTPALGIHASFLDFAGADSLRAFGRHVKTGLAIHYQNSFSKRFDYSITAAGFFLDFLNKNHESLGNGKNRFLLETDFSVRAKLAKPTAVFNPYVQAGVGVSSYNGYFGMFIPTGLGCQVNFTKDVFLLVNSQYRIAATNTQHRHFYHSIGLAGAITRKKINKPVPVAPPPPILSQPIDSDGDGILDSSDHCPTVPGMIKYQGCPPPDRDGDRIIDEEDDCPDVKGEAAYKGCPPPDKDQDGVLDADDKCPDMPGTNANSGCPEIPVAMKARIDSAAQQIFFETGSHALLKKSFPALQEVTQILKANASINLLIEGHTDNTGTAAKNQVLSRNRALSVMNYLLKAGIETNRLEATGFGQDRPVAGNNTPEGRAKNRRVVFVVKF